MIKKLAIVGVGLIGGSLARALKEAEFVGEIVGCARSEKSLKTALKLNIIDSMEMDPQKAVLGADMVVVATPVGISKSIFKAIAPHISPFCVVTDVGSVKSSVLADWIEILGEVPSWFVPGHPIAGTENSGAENSFETLFENKKTILTPIEITDIDKLEKVKKMWETVGSCVLTMQANEHDKIFSATSHLPHVLAYAMVNSLADRPELFTFSGGGFKDFTRIASSSPEMWRDICLANREELLNAIHRFQSYLQTIETSISRQDGDEILTLFNKSQTTKKSFC